MGEKTYEEVNQLLNSRKFAPLQKALNDPRAIHKYIKREKNDKGEWIYWYNEPKTGKNSN